MFEVLRLYFGIYLRLKKEIENNMIDHLITFQFSIAVTLDAFCRNIL